jgi:hypothetical protein
VTGVLGPALSGALFYGYPLMVIYTDIAGMPVVIYALISTAIPVVIATVFGNLILERAIRRPKRPSVWRWHILGTSLGALAGALAGLVFVRATGMVLTGMLTGAACGYLQAWRWWRAAPPDTIHPRGPQV